MQGRLDTESSPADGTRSLDRSEASLPGQALLAAIAAATQPLVEPSDIMETSARLLAEHLGVDRGAHAEVENESCFVITGDYAPAVPSIVGRWAVAAFGPACVRCMLAGEPYVVDDVETHPEIDAEHLLAYRATLVRRLVEMHGGSVEAESAGLHQGSTFTVRLPLARSTADQTQSTSIAAPVADPRALRVLVVDDSVDGAEALAMFLELSGHLTCLAHDGRQALMAAGEFQPHVVFLDIGLPGMNGYDVARALRSQPSSAPPHPRRPMPGILSWDHARRSCVLPSFSRCSGAHVAAYAPLRCSRKPRQNSSLAGGAAR